MLAFEQPVLELAELAEMKALLREKTGVIQLSGCIDAQKGQMIKTLGEGFRCKLVLSGDMVSAQRLQENYKFYEKKTYLFPARDMMFYQSDMQGNSLTSQRLEVIRGILSGEECTIFTTVDALMERLIPLEEFLHAGITLRVGEEGNLAGIRKKLVKAGYHSNYQVELPGQFAFRGGILDIYPMVSEVPYRVEFWGDEVDSIRSFDVESQRSIENHQEITIFPAQEVLIDEMRELEGKKKIEKEYKSRETKLRKEMKTEEAARLRRQVMEFLEEMGETRDAGALPVFLTYYFEEMVSLLDYLPQEERILFLDEPARISESAKAAEKEFKDGMERRYEKGYILPKQRKILRSFKEVREQIRMEHCAALCGLDQMLREWKCQDRFSIQVKSINSYNHSMELLKKDLMKFKKQKYRVILLSPSHSRAKRMAEELLADGLNSFYTEQENHEIKPGEVMVFYGKLARGFEYPAIKYAVITEMDIFGAVQKKKSRRSKAEGQRIQSFTELSVGDYVVHEENGLGRYKGLERVEVDHVTKDYLLIEYGDGGRLYVPVTQLENIQKYAGADTEKPPKLHDLGGKEWKKTRGKVQKAVEEVAKDLVELYAVRQKESGFPYGPDTVWQKEFEEMFPFEETQDQLEAIEATKRDMESTKIMDRLICGDVGFGKTEIAIRAAFKAIQEGKQVAYLVPTTILAQQHYTNFVERMKDYPVVVGLLCRFRTPKQQKDLLQDLKHGMADIVIGTHRLLSKDVEFKDLGLLIIDEEQRFGVRHKEKIKQMKKNVDVLTLTATPIPRTLHMSLIGIRDMSVLEEPPVDRLPIQTFVMEYDDEMVREAVNRELSRGGQVYYIYNRVSTIEEVTFHLRELLPEAVIEYAHGQMSQRELENVMYEFINGEIDVLVSTTIIETGMDIPNVNTMIIQGAERLGLSQLHQLRGRVGRSNRMAYAFLMYQKDRMIPEVAEKRLQAIKEFTQLGSGIRIAMKDLEIRGAGNLLGESQSGHMQAVGYELYCKMLNEAVRRYKGEDVIEQKEIRIEVNVSAFLPETYIPNEFQRLDLYKRIAGIYNDEEYDDLLEELIDRFGDLPSEAENLMWVAKLKNIARKAEIIEIRQRPAELVFTMHGNADVMVEKLPELLQQYHGRLKFVSSKAPMFLYVIDPHMELGEKESKQLLFEIASAIRAIHR